MANKASEKAPLGRVPLGQRENAEVPVAPLHPSDPPPARPENVPAQLRAQAVDPRTEEMSDRASALEREVAALRVQSAAALGALASAEEQLGAAAKRIGEIEEIRRQSMPPPPTELNELRTQVARVAVEMNELRADRDEHKRVRDLLQMEVDSLRAQTATLVSAQATHDARVSLLESAAQSNNEKARAEADRAEDLERQRAVLAADLQRARKAIDELIAEREQLKTMSEQAANQAATAALDLRAAADAGAGLRGELESRAAQIASLHREMQEHRSAEAKLRGELELERTQSRAREVALVNEVRERENRMLAEVQARETRLVEMAQAREKQLMAEAEAALQALGRDAQPLAARVAVLQKALEQSREREATLDAEARLRNNNSSIDAGEREQQLEEQLEGARRDARAARDSLHELQESKHRAESRATELQGTIDSLGMERAALRAEAGQLRAQVEMMNAVEKRAHQLLQELEELRGENDFLNQEVARYAAADGGKPAPTPPRKRPG